ncbi:MAG: hypothetical protein M1836_004150 [Candelina mexicana]|nr:MAG: hypothetical protein M1836_004150 [Candelina mexicana]
MVRYPKLPLPVIPDSRLPNLSSDEVYREVVSWMIYEHYDRPTCDVPAKDLEYVTELARSYLSMNPCQNARDGTRQFYKTLDGLVSGEHDPLPFAYLMHLRRRIECHMCQIQQADLYVLVADLKYEKCAQWNQHAYQQQTLSAEYNGERNRRFEEACRLVKEAGLFHGPYNRGALHLSVALTESQLELDDFKEKVLIMKRVKVNTEKNERESFAKDLYVTQVAMAYLDAHPGRSSLSKNMSLHGSIGHLFAGKFLPSLNPSSRLLEILEYRMEVMWRADECRDLLGLDFMSCADWDEPQWSVATRRLRDKERYSKNWGMLFDVKALSWQPEGVRHFFIKGIQYLSAALEHSQLDLNVIEQRIATLDDEWETHRRKSTVRGESSREVIAISRIPCTSESPSAESHAKVEDTSRRNEPNGVHSTNN